MHHHHMMMPPHHHSSNSHNVAHSANANANSSSNGNGNTGNNADRESVLDVLHIGPDENKNFGALAVTLNQIYGSRNTNTLPFGATRSSAITFDGRIQCGPVLTYLQQAIKTPSKKVRVYELSPLASSDRKAYDELVSIYTKYDRCSVADKEYTMGILLYFIPPKLIFKKVDPANFEADPRKKNAGKHKKEKAKAKGKDSGEAKTNFVELLNLHHASSGMLKDDKVWMIWIESTSKYLMYKQKQKEKQAQKEQEKKDKKKSQRKKQLNEISELSDIEISSDDDDASDSSGSGDSDEQNADGMHHDGESPDGDGERKSGKWDDVEKSELIVALEAFYGQIGHKLPE